MKTAIAHSQVNQGNWCQETYETASRHARIRAKQLRKAGYKVSTSPMGPQVTKVGTVKLTMVHILPGQNKDTFELPDDNWKFEGI